MSEWQVSDRHGKVRTYPNKKSAMSAWGSMPDGATVSKVVWEYGFYDSHPRGNWADAPEPQTDPTIYWYVFGILTHETAESAEHTGRKSVNGSPVIVRRRKGSTDWDHVTEAARSTSTERES